MLVCTLRMFRALILMTLLMPISVWAGDVYLQTQSDIGIGSSADQTNIRAVGTLKAGSVIAIPQAFVVTSRGSNRVDVKASLEKWAQQTQRQPGFLGPKTFAYKGQQTHLFYPVQVVRPAAGSRMGPAETKWIAIGSLVETENATVVPASVAFPAQAQTQTPPERTETNSTCTTCTPVPPGVQSTQRAANEIIRVLTPRAPVQPPRSQLRDRPQGASHSPPPPAMPNSCSDIISPDGRIGTWGQQMTDIMTEPQYVQNFYKNNALGRLCPKFAELTPLMKTKAWLWFWASLADVESKCDVNVEHPTHYTDRRTGQQIRLNPEVGWGLWAMEKSATSRRRRGEECSRIDSFAGQARCSIQIMNRHQLAAGKTATNDGESYWGPLRGRRVDTQMMPLMRRFQACF